MDTESDEETLSKLALVNGVLFPGGHPERGYLAKAQFIYDQAKEINDAGTYFPLFGICKGFLYMSYFASDVGTDLAVDLPSQETSLPIKFTVDPAETKMFKDIGERKKDYESVAFAYNMHDNSIAVESFETDAGLKDMFKLTSTCTDESEGTTFGCSMESDKYPFAAVMFHPEKQLGQFYDDIGLNHSWESIQLNRFFADYYVNMAREQTNNAGDFSAVQKLIIENYDHFVTDTTDGDVYVFDKIN